MAVEDNTIEPKYNPFDAPVPGQSLTDEPGNYPWEHPPRITEPEEALDRIWNRMTTPEMSEQIILMLESGVPVEALTRVITFTGFAEGEFTPDVGFLLAEPIMKMITAIGMRAGVENLRISLADMSNKETVMQVASLQEANKKAVEVAKNISKDIEGVATEVKPESAGLLSKPMPQEEQEEM